MWAPRWLSHNQILKNQINKDYYTSDTNSKLQSDTSRSINLWIDVA